MVILVREDLKISCGKLAVQVAHAAVECSLRSEKDILEKWLSDGAKKVVLKVKNYEELLFYYDMAKKEGLNSVLIKDAGLTELEPGTVTCVGIGPDTEEKINKITGKLPLYK